MQARGSLPAIAWARNILGVLKAQAVSPRGVKAMTPPSPPRLVNSLMDGVMNGTIEREAAAIDERADVAGQRQADEVLAGSGSRDSA